MPQSIRTTSPTRARRNSRTTIRRCCPRSIRPRRASVTPLPRRARTRWPNNMADNYIAVVFDDDKEASDALHELWRLDGTGDITVHGAAVLHRDKFGYVQVATKQT